MSSLKMQEMANKVLALLPKGFGFIILVFPFYKKNGVSNYISNANRSDMIKALREAADKLENKQDFEYTKQQ